MKIHISMSLSELTKDPLLELTSSMGIHPELFLNGNEVEGLTVKEYTRIGDTLSKMDLIPISIHAPFDDLSPGSSDETIRNISVQKILRAVDLAKYVPVEGVVVHSGYSDWHFDFQVDRWLKNAIPSFLKICERADSFQTRIFVENIFEKTPDSLVALREATGADNLHYCFDPGHAALFSSLPLVTWIKTLGDGIEEVHLHDNCGKRDEHLPLLEGSINFRGVLSAIKELDQNTVYTLEPHTVEHAERTISNFKKLVCEIYGEPFQGIF